MKQAVTWAFKVRPLADLTRLKLAPVRFRAKYSETLEPNMVITDQKIVDLKRYVQMNFEETLQQHDNPECDFVDSMRVAMRLFRDNNAITKMFSLDEIAIQRQGAAHINVIPTIAKATTMSVGGNSSNQGLTHLPHFPNPVPESGFIHLLKKRGSIIPIGYTAVGGSLAANSLTPAIVSPYIQEQAEKQAQVDYPDGRGSSGGAACMTLVVGKPILGSDIGGSIAYPAALFGLFGFKASTCHKPLMDMLAMQELQIPLPPPEVLAILPNDFGLASHFALATSVKDLGMLYKITMGQNPAEPFEKAKTHWKVGVLAQSPTAVVRCEGSAGQTAWDEVRMDITTSAKNNIAWHPLTTDAFLSPDEVKDCYVGASLIVAKLMSRVVNLMHADGKGLPKEAIFGDPQLGGFLKTLSLLGDKIDEQKDIAPYLIKFDGFKEKYNSVLAENSLDAIAMPTLDTNPTTRELLPAPPPHNLEALGKDELLALVVYQYKKEDLTALYANILGVPRGSMPTNRLETETGMPLGFQIMGKVDGDGETLQLMQDMDERAELSKGLVAFRNQVIPDLIDQAYARYQTERSQEEVGEKAISRHM